MKPRKLQRTRLSRTVQVGKTTYMNTMCARTDYLNVGDLFELTALTLQEKGLVDVYLKRVSNAHTKKTNHATLVKYRVKYIDGNGAVKRFFVMARDKYIAKCEFERKHDFTRITSIRRIQ